MRAVFFGTPEIAVPTLRVLTEVAFVTAVVCQPDRPAGRGLALKAPAVKIAAQQLGLPVHQPLKVRTGQLDEWLRAERADVALVLAYGRILPAAVLAAPRRGCMNLHASLLPKYRGAAPIQWALMQGETVTGISLMQMDVGLDTGPVYSRHLLPIASNDDTASLSEKLADLAAVVVQRDLARAVNGELVAEPQNDALASLAPPLTAADARVDWNRGAARIADQVRGLAPKPSAWTLLDRRRLKILRAHADVLTVDAKPGSVVHADKNGIQVATGQGALIIERAQLEGRKPLDAVDLVNGRVLTTAMQLEAP